MRRAFIILFLACCLRASAAFVPTNEVDGTINGTSYDLGTTEFYGDYFSTYWYCMYPQYTNHIYSWSRSGTGWNGDYQQQEEKWCLPLWSSFSVPGYDWILASDNEGLVSNNTYTAGLLIASGPPLFYNGTGQTNEGVLTKGITHIPMGRVPHDSAAGDSGAIFGNDGSMALANTLGVPVIDLWHRLWTNGWSSDVVGARYLGFSAGSHPLAPGGLAVAMQQLLGLNVETNVGSLTFDWANASASADHSTASAITVSGNTLTATVHFDRMPMAWDSPDGSITNNATTAFMAMPSIGNALNWIVQVTNLPSGNYEIDVDGHFADSCTSVELAAGRNWATNCVPTNPLWLQRASVLRAKRYQQGIDPVTLTLVSPPNHNPYIPNTSDLVWYESYAGGQYDDAGKRGSNLVAAVDFVVTQLKQYDVKIWQAAQQTNHIFTITRVDQGGITLQRFPTGGVKMRSEALLTNAAGVDRSTAKLVSAGPSSAASGTVGVIGGWIYYLPPAGFTNSDSFGYVISDQAGLQATGSVTISILGDVNVSQNQVPSGGGIINNSPALQFLGIPGRNYRVQYSTNLVNWLPLGNVTADSSGVIIFSDNPPNGSAPRTYRTTYP